MLKLISPILVPLFLVFLTSCTIGYDAQRIVDKTIKKHGGSAYQNSRIAFSFRGNKYTAEHHNGRFKYQRTIADSTGTIVDKMTSDSFERTINGEPVQVNAEKRSAYSNALNSVIYFALLPYKLNDAAVIKKYLGKTTINNQPYYKIRVSFKQEGGGKDHDDTFMYWIHADDHTIDYLAYKFHVNGGGIRFREAYNIRTIKGIRFANYNNYKAQSDTVALENLDTLFEQGKLEKVSEINSENINVELLN